MERAKVLAERLCLYNREVQFGQLLEALGNACNGVAEILLLPGPSGVGRERGPYTGSRVELSRARRKVQSV